MFPNAFFLARRGALKQVGLCSNFVVLGHLYPQILRNNAINIIILKSDNMESSKSEHLKDNCNNASEFLLHPTLYSNINNTNPFFYLF